MTDWIIKTVGVWGLSRAPGTDSRRPTSTVTTTAGSRQRNGSTGSGSHRHRIIVTTTTTTTTWRERVEPMIGSINDTRITITARTGDR